MNRTKPTIPERVKYEVAAQEYLAGLTEENFMESTSQANQRKITVESMDVVRTARPDVQTFNELLIQYPKKGAGKRNVAGVVPDNMVIVHPEAIIADGSFDLPHQPVGPLAVMEYVSRGNKRKDYERSMTLYEKDIKVPYYLVFYPDDQELNLFKLKRGKYASVLPDGAGRRAIPELEVAVGLLAGWVRYWFRGELVPLPDELVRALDEERRERLAAEKRAVAAEKRAAEKDDEIARLRAELARMRG